MLFICPWQLIYTEHFHTPKFNKHLGRLAYRVKLKADSCQSRLGINLFPIISIFHLHSIFIISPISYFKICQVSRVKPGGRRTPTGSKSLRLSTWKGTLESARVGMQDHSWTDHTVTDQEKELSVNRTTSSATDGSSELAAEKLQSSICGRSKLALGKGLKIHLNIKKCFSELGKGPHIDHYF